MRQGNCARFKISHQRPMTDTNLSEEVAATFAILVAK